MDGTNELFSTWGKDRAIQGDPAFEHAQNTANASYSTGREAARAHLRP
ncbi:hypothetical protein [Streptomyces sp. NPDC051577]